MQEFFENFWCFLSLILLTINLQILCYMIYSLIKTNSSLPSIYFFMILFLYSYLSSNHSKTFFIFIPYLLIPVITFINALSLNLFNTFKYLSQLIIKYLLIFFYLNYTSFQRKSKVFVPHYKNI